jgi:hypothetical protein
MQRSAPPHLALQLALRALQVFEQQVLARELVVVGEVVDALPVRQVGLVELVVDPSGRVRIRIGRFGCLGL